MYNLVHSAGNLLSSTFCAVPKNRNLGYEIKCFLKTQLSKLYLMDKMKFVRCSGGKNKYSTFKIDFAYIIVRKLKF